jgi:hypothetical protein
MKQFLIATVFIFICTCAKAADFSGEYQCQLNDHSDGMFTATLTLKQDKSASFADIGYASYLIDLQVKGLPYAYTGAAVARGNDLAIYFESTGSKKNPDDKGVGIASVIVDQNKEGKKIISLHKFYYERSYKGKNNYGFELCSKVK